MSKRKGVSADEKRSRMLQLFYEKKDFFQLKELEKIAPKEKGIVMQSVKDVIQNLVDDGLVDTDKIGTSVYYWAFPSKALHVKKRKLGELEEKTSEVTSKLKKMKETLETAKEGKENTADREDDIAMIKTLKEKEDSLLNELKKYKDCDPEVLQDMKKNIQIAKEAANRWTDNIFTVRSWCKKKFMIEENILNKQFSIPEDLDYVD